MCARRSDRIGSEWFGSGQLTSIKLAKCLKLVSAPGPQAEVDYMTQNQSLTFVYRRHKLVSNTYLVTCRGSPTF